MRELRLPRWQVLLGAVLTVGWWGIPATADPQSATTPLGTNGCLFIARVVGLDPHGDNYLSTHYSTDRDGLNHTKDKLHTGDSVCVTHRQGHWLLVAYSRNNQPDNGWASETFLLAIPDSAKQRVEPPAHAPQNNDPSSSPNGIGISIKDMGDNVILIHVAGIIASGDGARFEAAVTDLERRVGRASIVVVLTSPGGSLDAGIEIGEVIHAHRYNTAASGASLHAPWHGQREIEE